MGEMLEAGDSDEDLPDEERGLAPETPRRVASQVLQSSGLSLVENHEQKRADMFAKRSENIIASTVRSGSKHLRKKK